MSSNGAPPPSQETASLVQRLAGPSTTKAGLAKDQSEINRIIADASKGSQFYENEKRKDKDLTERIGRILKQRDDVLKGVDLVPPRIEKVARKADHMLVELEVERDLSQIIVHVDMDAFYANTELLHRPDLDGKPFGVGKGILTTASYEARKYGVRSGMPGFIAQKLCPELVLLPINMSRYSEMSARVMSIFRDYDPNMLAASVDEGYLNITNHCVERGLDPDECVQQIRKRVVGETQLTVSAGIAANKMLAKICSDKNKPNGQYHLPHERDAILNFMHDLPIRKIPGVGRVNERLLDSIGIKTCGDIYTHRGVLSLMDKQFGLKFMLRTYLGIASNVVQPWAREERKSIGSERTFNPINDKDKILQKLDEVAAELEEDMTSSGWTGRTVTLKYKLDTYQVFTRAKSFDRWITTKADLFSTGKELLQPEWPLRIRLIGLRVTKLKDLRKKDDGRGIKRFFEAVHGSPSKRRKVSHEDSGPVHDDEDDDVMPGFHEHEGDTEHEPEVWDVDTDEQVPISNRPSARPRPPASAPVSSQPSSRPPLSSIKPRSSAASAGPSHSNAIPKYERQDPQADAAEELTLACPICAASFIDNDQLNEHIDWCLSREAIRSAQADAGSTPNTAKRKGATETQRGKEAKDDGRKEWWKTRGLAEGLTRKTGKGKRAK